MLTQNGMPFTLPTFMFEMGRQQSILMFVFLLIANKSEYATMILSADMHFGACIYRNTYSLSKLLVNSNRFSGIVVKSFLFKCLYKILFIT